MHQNNNEATINYKVESEMFDQMADYYDKYRPGYPQEIIEIYLKEASIQPGDHLLEIGAGSGKATAQFCGKGLNITCIEPGERLAEIGQKRFSDEQFKFVVSRFEDMQNNGKIYDSIFSAQAFHWVPKPKGYQKAATLLKDNGTLALIWNMYITFPSDIDRDLITLSKRYGGFADFVDEADSEERIRAIKNEIEESGYFVSLEVYRFLWRMKYTPEDYFGFVMTGNRFVQKSAQEKEQAKKDIWELASRYGGIIERPYLCVMYLAKKKGKPIR